MTELLRARPTNTFIMRRLSHDAPANNQTGAVDIGPDPSIMRTPEADSFLGGRGGAQ